jgi:hypothetical protein
MFLTVSDLRQRWLMDPLAATSRAMLPSCSRTRVSRSLSHRLRHSPRSLHYRLATHKPTKPADRTGENAAMTIAEASSHSTGRDVSHACTGKGYDALALAEIVCARYRPAATQPASLIHASAMTVALMRWSARWHSLRRKRGLSAASLGHGALRSRRPNPGNRRPAHDGPLPPGTAGRQGADDRTDDGQCDPPAAAATPLHPPGHAPAFAPGSRIDLNRCVAAPATRGYIRPARSWNPESSRAGGILDLLTPTRT